MSRTATGVFEAGRIFPWYIPDLKLCGWFSNDVSNKNSGGFYSIRKFMEIEYPQWYGRGDSSDRISKKDASIRGFPASTKTAGDEQMEAEERMEKLKKEGEEKDGEKEVLLKEGGLSKKVNKDIKKFFNVELDDTKEEKEYVKFEKEEENEESDIEETESVAASMRQSPDNHLGFSEMEQKEINEDTTKDDPRYKVFFKATEGLNKTITLEEQRKRMPASCGMPDYLAPLQTDREALYLAKTAMDAEASHMAPLPEWRPRVISGDEVKLMKKDGEHVVVGAGGWGIAVMGQMMKTKQDVVIKFTYGKNMNKEDNHHRNLLRQAITECQIQSHLHSECGDLVPGVLGLAVVTDDEEKRFFRYAIVQEFVRAVPGEEYSLTFLKAMCLDSALRQQSVKLFTKSAWYQLVLKLVTALERFAKLRVIHLDMKLDNVLLKIRNGQITPVIIDFGFASINQTCVDELPVAFSRNILSTLENHPSTPFEVVANRQIGPKSDLYSLGQQLMYLGKQLQSKKLQKLCESMMIRNVKKRADHDVIKKKLTKLVKCAKRREAVRGLFERIALRIFG